MGMEKTQEHRELAKMVKTRAKALVKSANGSNKFTCANTSCTYPKCACGL